MDLLALFEEFNIVMTWEIKAKQWMVSIFK